MDDPVSLNFFEVMFGFLNWRWVVRVLRCQNALYQIMVLHIPI